MSSMDFTPASIDFNAYLASDPTYQNAIQAINDRQAADLASTNAGIYTGLIDFGDVPTDPTTGQPVSSLPPTIADQILGATRGGVSQIGQLAYQYLLDQSQVRGVLGDRGAIRSGDYAYETNKNLRAQQVGRQTALNKLFQLINGLQGNYGSQLTDLLGQRGTVTQDAFSRLIALINARAAAAAAQPPPTTDTTPPPNDPTGGGTTGPTSWPPAAAPGAPDATDFTASTTQPTTPYVEAGQVVQEPKLSEQQGYNAYGGFIDQTPSVPDIPAPAPIDFLQQNSSDAGGRSVYVPTAPTPSPVAHAAPKPAGYGGTATKNQVARNSF